MTITDQQRATIVTLVADVAPLLTHRDPALSGARVPAGWTPVRDRNGVADSLQNADGARLSFGTVWNRPDRIVIRGQWLTTTQYNWTKSEDRGLSPFEITVAATRAPKAIAAEIARRLLPDYLRVFAYTKAAEAQAADEERQRRRKVDTVAALFPDAKTVNPDRPTGRGEDFWFGKYSEGGVIGEGRVSLRKIDLKLDNLTLAQVEAIARILFPVRFTPTTENPTDA